MEFKELREDGTVSCVMAGYRPIFGPETWADKTCL